ncbi:MAG: PD40 domain-containing protein [Myxococcales bacterium]|nr:MAG: PD40 domain-containing protein [Myxococcales bacterium]
MIWCFLAILLGSALLVALPGGAEAQVRDPHLQWKTIRTKHFEINYYEPLGLIARRAAVVAERAHQILAPLIAHRPHERTRIVLTDETDSANGSATALPYNTIRIFATAPEDISPLGDYDDWLSELIIHEYTHILHLDQIGGIPKIINTVFGKIVSPNNAQPRWFIEGLAVNEESLHTSGGRLRSTMFDMYLRMNARQAPLWDLDQLSHIADRWPHGTSWYLYGAYFVNFIYEHFGRKALQEITSYYGRQAIPYGINRAVKRATGHNFEELYALFLDHLRKVHQNKLNDLKSQGLVEGRRLTFQGEDTNSPRFLDNNELIYHESNNTMRGHLRHISLSNATEGDVLARVIGTTYLSIHPDKNQIVYTATDNYRDIYRLYDLFIYDRKNDESTRISHGLRARDPDLSSDGNRLAFTINGLGTTHLGVAKINDFTGSKKILIRSKPSELIYTPKWSPDGKQIAYSQWSRGGYRDIWTIDVATKHRTRITHDRAVDSGPCWSPDGSQLYFSSDRSGIANIYAYRVADRSLWQVTNVIGGAYQPTVSPNGKELVYVGYTSFGFDLFHLSMHKPFRPALPYVNERPPPIDDSDILFSFSEPYSPFPTLLPQAYTLDLQPDGFGQQLGINVHGEDVAQWHAYDARVGVSLQNAQSSVDFRYAYQRSPTRFNLGLYRFANPGGGLEVAGERQSWIESRSGADFTLAYVFPRTFHSESISLTQTFAYIDNAEPFEGKLDPNTPHPVFPRLGLLARTSAGWSYSNVERYIYNISASRGHSIGFNVSVSSPALGSQYEAVSLTWRASKFITMPWLKQHVLALRYGGGISTGDIAGRSVFGVGGFPSQAVLNAVIDGTSLGGVVLRGYKPFARVGTQFHLLQNEYRFLIYRTQQGLSTLPIYANRVYASVYADLGNAFLGSIDFRNFLLGVGGEVLLDFTLGYYLHFTLRAGLAQGMLGPIQTQPYLNLGFPF